MNEVRRKKLEGRRLPDVMSDEIADPVILPALLLISRRTNTERKKAEQWSARDARHRR
jgi:hypothetical protein